MHLTEGSLLRGGAYRIEKMLGQGSFGITYRATQLALDKTVAIKEFYMREMNSRKEDGSITGTDSNFTAHYAQKFKKEALNLAKLEHPNIVRVTDSFDENGTYYYVMDFIEGQNLNDYIKSHAITEQEAVSIICDVAEALAYMHEQHRMLHLDLKPGNIMRRACDGHIYLIDFGLSKHYSSDGQPETSTTIGLGTTGYAPIEQGNQARNGEFRATIDVYALGATLYKLLTGETPPAASELISDEGVLERAMQAKGISQSLIGIVAKAMMPNVNRRFQTIRDFRDSLLSSDTFGASNQEGEQNNFSTMPAEETQVMGQQRRERITRKQLNTGISDTQLPTKPETHLWQSVLVTLLVVFIATIVGIIGIVAIFKAINVNNEYKNGNYEGALKKSKQAKWLNVTALLSGIVAFVLATASGFNLGIIHCIYPDIYPDHNEYIMPDTNNNQISESYNQQTVASQAPPVPQQVFQCFVDQFGYFQFDAYGNRIDVIIPNGPVQIFYPISGANVLYFDGIYENGVLQGTYYDQQGNVIQQ